MFIVKKEMMIKMEIDISVIILIIAIVGANSIVLVKIFYKDETDKEKKEIQKEFPVASKSCEKRRTNNPEKLLTINKNDLNNETTTENTEQCNEKIAKNKNEKDLATEKSEYAVEIAENKIDENEEINTEEIREIIPNENTVAEIIIEDKVYELSLKDNIIFTYNNETYSSYVLEIKHDNVKIKYRSQEKWINFSDIKKIL